MDPIVMFHATDAATTHRTETTRARRPRDRGGGRRATGPPGATAGTADVLAGLALGLVVPLALVALFPLAVLTAPVALAAAALAVRLRARGGAPRGDPRATGPPARDDRGHEPAD